MPPVSAPSRTDAPRSSGRDLLEDSALTSFHRRLTVYSAGGPFLDGLILGVIGVALTQIGPRWHLSGLWEGLLAAAALCGLLIGGTVFGYVTDRFGRHIMYTIDLAAIVVFSVAQAFVNGPEQLLVLRFLIGVAVGADYPIATSLLAEFSPRKHRGAMLGLLTVMWSVGSAAAYLIGDLLLRLGPDGWRWLLACPAVPAAILVLLRIGTPESPRWLLSQGRVEEAEAVMRKVFGPGAGVADLGTPAEPARFSAVFRGAYGRRTAFVSVFWACSVMPIYAIYAFGPQLLAAMGLAGNSGTLGSVAISLVFLVGCVVFLPLLNRRDGVPSSSGPSPRPRSRCWSSVSSRGCPRSGPDCCSRRTRSPSAAPRCSSGSTRTSCSRRRSGPPRSASAPASAASRPPSAPS